MQHDAAPDQDLHCLLTVSYVLLKFERKKKKNTTQYCLNCKWAHSIDKGKKVQSA